MKKRWKEKKGSTKTPFQKAVAVALVIFLLANCLPAAAFAAQGKMGLKLSSSAGAPGKTVEITVEISQNPGIASLKFDIVFDEAILSLTSISFSEGFGSYISASEPYKSPQTISMVSPLGNNTYNGVLANLTFLISPDAPNNFVSDITVICDQENTFDSSFQDVEVEVTDGAVRVANLITGECGENLIWTLDRDTGLLTIFGTGAMDDWNSTMPLLGRNAPWYSYCSEIKTVSLPDGLTSVGAYAFYNCSNLTSITIPDGVASIGDRAFYSCQNLSEVMLSDGVTSIGSYAFYNCASLESVIIPESVTTINSYAFSRCENLDTITIQSDQCEIYDRNDTLGSRRMTTIFAHAGSTAEAYAQKYDYTFKTLSVPEAYLITGECGENLTWSFSEYTRELIITGSGEMTDWTSISDVPWYSYRSNIKSISLPDGLTSIGIHAFLGCNNLKSIDLPNSLTSIGTSAFYGCSKLTSVTIPNKVTNIADGAFMYCNGLSSIEVASDNPSFSSLNGVLFDKNKTVLYICPGAMTGSYQIPDSVTSIGAYAFFNCINLTNIDLPDGITSIGYYAFGNCSNLTNIVLPDGATSIGSFAFSSCSKLTNINLPDGVTSIGSAAFWSCTSLMSIVLPDSVTSIGSDAFHNCSKLASINLPDGMTSIDNDAFFNCSNLANIEFPDSLTRIGEHAFSHCSNLSNINLPESITNIGRYAFNECSNLESIQIFSDQCKIGSISGTLGVPGTTTIYAHAGSTAEAYAQTYGYAFETLSVPDENLITGECGDNLTWSFNEDTGELIITGSGKMTNWTSSSNVPWYSYRSSIQSVSLPDGLTSIGNRAFYGCSNLTNINLPDGVTSIGASAFYGCSSLTSVTIPNQVTSIANSAFQNCSSLSSIVVASDNPSFSSLNGVLFDKNKTVLYTCPGAMTGSYQVPDGVTSIGNLAFYGCGELTSIRLPDSVVSIGTYAFFNCSKLTSINLPDGVTGIGTYTFYNCSKLTSIDLPDGVTSIGSYAFNGCSSLTSIDLPENVTSIGKNAFAKCTSLKGIAIPTSVMSIGQEAFGACSSLGNITIWSDQCEISSDSATLGVPGTTMIFAHADSTAETYARDYGYSFTILSEQEMPINYMASSYHCKISFIKRYAGGNPAVGAELGLFNAGGDLLARSYTTEDGKRMIIREGSDGPTGNPWGETSYTPGADEDRVTFDPLAGLRSGQLFYIQELAAAQGFPIDETKYYLFITSHPSAREIVEPITQVEGSPVMVLDNWSLFLIPAYGDIYIYYLNYDIDVTSRDRTWSFDQNTGELTIFDNCEMANWTSVSDVPWYPFHLSIKSVSLPDGLSSIGRSAFENCSNLTSIDLPDSVTSIGRSAFSGCSSLTSIDLPDGVTSINSFAFYGCSSLASIDLPDGVTSIGSDAFFNCSKLTSINLPDGVTSIGSYAFTNCSSLTSINYPDGLISIGASAFYYCIKLTNIDLPESITSIGRDAFEYCRSLESITVLNDLCEIDDSSATLGVPGTTTIYAHAGSTAETYAQNHGYEFVPIPVAGPFTVAYDANGGSGEPEEQEKTEGVALTLSDLIPSKSFTITYNANGGSVSPASKTVNCTFKNWNTAANGGGTDYNPGAQYTADADVTLYAQWDHPTVGTMSTPSRANYTFDGWFTAATGGSQVTSSTPVSGNMTIYAHWTPIPKTYVISYNANGGSGAPAAQEKTEGVALTLSTARPAKSFTVTYNANGGSVSLANGGSVYLDTKTVKCTFKNWNTAANGGGTDYNPGEQYNVDADVTLYAQWGHPTVGALPTPTRVDYTFDGWYTASTGGSQVTSSTPVSGNMTVYAHWTPIPKTYVISYDANGGSGAPSVQEKTEGVALTLSDSIPSKSFTVTYNANRGSVSPASETVNCTFKNWNTAANGGGTSYNPGAQYTADADITLYAQWDHPTVGALPTPERTGYTFDGWYTEAVEGDEVSISTVVTDNLTIYAHWKEIPSGECGEDLTWSFHEDTGELTISGEGDMTDWSSSSDVPWNSLIESILDVSLPSGLTSIGSYAFYECSNLESVEIPDSVTAIGASAFSGCSSLTAVEVPGSVTIINEAAFSYCINLTIIIIINNQCEIDDNDGTLGVPGTTTIQSGEDSTAKTYADEHDYEYVHTEHSYVSVVTPPSCTEKGYTTYTCTCGDSYVDDEVPALGHDYSAVITAPTCTQDGYTTYTCSRCGDSYTGGETAALDHDWGEGVVTKEPTATSEGVLTFTCSRCGVKRTESILYNKCGNNLTWSFDEATGSLTITGYGAMDNWDSDDKVPWYRYRAQITELSLPGGLTGIGQYAFYSCSSLEAVTIPDSVTNIGKYAFRYCSSLEAVTIPDYVLYIDKYAFQNCTSLKEASIGTGTARIEEGAFRDCPALEKVAIWNPTCDFPENSTTISDAALGKTVIYGFKGSSAEMYAIKWGYAFKALIPQFEDVPEDKYYTVPVRWAVDLGITTGTSDTTFSPDSTCTRAQVVTFLWRASGSPEPAKTDNPFTDVKPGAYYYKAVLWAVERGITNGVSATAFGPDSGCTRGQVVTFLWRSSGQPEPKSSSNPFTDVEPGAYYYKPVLWAVENNITNGTSPDRFSPAATCTRGQIVTFLYRAMGGQA